MLLPQPVIGEIRKGKDLGRHPSNYFNKFIWLPCEICGQERWVRLIKGEPKYRACQLCAIRAFDQQRVGARNPTWKGGRVSGGGGYTRVLNKEHPRADSSGYVYEHILVWEKANGRSLPEGWVIHHLNGRKTDNRSENLLAIPRKSHHYALLLEAVRKRVRILENELKAVRSQGVFHV